MDNHAKIPVVNQQTPAPAAVTPATGVDPSTTFRLRGVDYPKKLTSIQQAHDWIDVLEVELARCRRLQAKADAVHAGVWSTLPFGFVTAALASWIAVAVPEAQTPSGQTDSPADWFFIVAVMFAIAYAVAWFLHEKFLPWKRKDRSAAWKNNDQWVRDLENLLLEYKRQLRGLEAQRR